LVNFWGYRNTGFSGFFARRDEFCDTRMSLGVFPENDEYAIFQAFVGNVAGFEPFAKIARKACLALVAG
jgi:hypothetical protein